MMCCGLIVHSRIENLIFSTKDPKSGAVVSRAHLLDSDFVNPKLIITRTASRRSFKSLEGFFQTEEVIDQIASIWAHGQRFLHPSYVIVDTRPLNF